MRLLPKAIVQPKPDDGLGKGMEIVITLAVFLGGGYLLDRWLGTMPVFTIALSMLAMVGQFVKMWYAYDARMTDLEAQRASTMRAPGVDR